MRILAVLLLCSLPLSPQGRGRGRGKQSADANVVFSFSSADRRILQDYARTTPPAGLPPGLARRGELPPGLQKQLQRNGTLPPGLQKKVTPFPADLDRRLDPLPASCGCDRVFLEGKALLVVRATRAILDVINLF